METTDKVLLGMLLAIAVFFVALVVVNETNSAARDRTCQQAGYDECTEWDSVRWCVRYTEGTIDHAEMTQYKLVAHDAS